jgi:type VI secretion system secreted protein VgrG
MALAKKVSVLIDGKNTVDGKDTGDFLDLNLQQNMFGHHSLEIVYRRDLFEGNDSFILDKSDRLFLGAKISISIEVKSNEKVEFDGIITGVKARKLNDAQSDTIIIEAASPDIMLDDGEHCRTFEDKPLKSIVDKILGEYQLNTDYVKPENASDSLPYTVQYKESAYAFLARMASKKAQWFYYDGVDIIFGARKQKKVNLEFGADLFNFDFSLKLEDLKFKFLSYDYLNNAVISSESGDKKITNLSAKAKVAYDISEKKYKHETLSLYNHSLTKSKEKEHLDKRVKLIKSSITAGFISVNGSTDNPNLVLGCEIKINENAGQGSNKKKVDQGSYIITGLSHTCDRKGNYQNNFNAVPADIEVPPYSTPHAIPFSETQIAKVMDNNDPEKLGRIRVQFIWQESENTITPWIRIVSPHASDEIGFYFIPEISDEVLVAFEGGNAEKPYVMGSMYHGKAKPDSAWVNSTDDIKAIRTRSGHTIEFSDKDGKEEIKIYDNKKDNYVITLASHSKKIMIECKGDIEMEAKGDLKIKAKNIEMESQSDFKMKTTNMKIDATSQYEVAAMNITSKANAQMKLEASAMIEQKAALIKIN